MRQFKIRKSNIHAAICLAITNLRLLGPVFRKNLLE